MKRIQPYYYIVGLAGLFMITGLVLFLLQLMPAEESNGITVDPLTQEQGEALYDLWFDSAVVYDLSVDHALSGILFSTDADTVSLLDRERRLRWDKLFVSAPVQAKLSSCGNYAAVGTSGGRLFFTSIDQQFWWDHEGDAVDQIALSPNATWIVAARSQPPEEFDEGTGTDRIDLFSQSGAMKWSLETGPVENIFISSEYLEQVNIYYTSLVDGIPVISAANLEGEILWSNEGQRLAAVSKHGSRLAVIESNRLLVYDSLGYELWSTQLPFEARTVVFNPQNYNRILVYGSREGVGENLYYFDLADDLLWMKRIPDGSLFSFTADGQYILASSWRHYKEDYTQMILLDRDGFELNNWEVSMRIEHLIVTGHPHLVVVCGEDGYIDLLDLKPLIIENGNGLPAVPIYSPVTTGIRPDETKIMLYFIDEKSNLIPVTRTVNYTDSPLRVALEELIRGPARGSELFRTIPDKEYSIDIDFTSEDGRLLLDLSPELVQLNGSTQTMVAFNSLLMTVSAFAEVDEIYLSVEGELLEVFGESMVLDQPLKPFSFDKPIFTPISSGKRYYLVAQEGALAGSGETDLQNLVEQVLRSFRSLNLVPSNLALLDLRVFPEQIVINLNSYFPQIFPDEITEQDRLRAVLLLDALFLTVFENSKSQRVVILADGEKYEPPAGYPATSRFLRTPYFINPEQ